MKKIAILIFFLFIASITNGQQAIGLRIGPNVTKSSGGIVFENTAARIGLSTALTYQRYLNRLFFLACEIKFEERGYGSRLVFRDSAGDPTGEETFFTNFSYLSLPVKFGRSYPGKIEVSYAGGLVPAYLIKATEDLPEGGEIRITKYMSSFDLAVLAEIEAAYHLKGNLLLSFSTSGQLSATKWKDSLYGGGAIKGRHWGVNPALGIKYLIGKK